MKKNYSIILIILFTLLVGSCNNMWMNRQAMMMKSRSVEEVIDGVAGDIAIDGESLQKKLDEAEAKKNEPFPATNFDSWVFYMTSIDRDNVCTYTFANGTWEKEGSYETYKGPDIGSGQMNASWNLKYYKYKTRKDRWAASTEQNFDPELDAKALKNEERFLFFKFTGDAKANTKLNNSMLCVDTYTKFVFNYSEPGNIKEIIGNKVPQKWQDYADPNTSVGNNHVMGYTTPFYLYDPVGYVKDSGEVIYYKWANENIKKANYAPALHEDFTGVATYDPNGEGHSPYLPEGMAGGGTPVVDEPEPPVPNDTPADTEVFAQVSIKAKYIKNINMGDQKQPVVGIFAVFGHEMNVQFEGKEKQRLAYTRAIGDGYLASELNTAYHGKEYTALQGGTKLTPRIKNVVKKSENSRFVLTLDLRKYKRNPALKTTEEEILITPKAELIFEYNMDEDAIIFIERKKGMGKNVAIDGYKNFRVSRNSTKDLVLRFTKKNKIVEVCFEMSLSPDGSGKEPDHLKDLPKLKAKLVSMENVSIGGQASWSKKPILDPYCEKDPKNKETASVNFAYFNYKTAINDAVFAEYTTNNGGIADQNTAKFQKGKSWAGSTLENYKEISTIINRNAEDVKLMIELSKHDGYYRDSTMWVFKKETNQCEISKSSDEIVFKYDKATKKLSAPSTEKTLSDGIKCKYNAFSLTKGETKEFVVTFDNVPYNRKDGSTETGSFKITYELQME